jgi:hypothetical protein
MRKLKRTLIIFNRLKRNFYILNRVSIIAGSAMIMVAAFELVFYAELGRLFDVTLCTLMIGVNILLEKNNKKGNSHEKQPAEK